MAHLVGGNKKDHRETGNPPWRRQYRGIDLGFTLEYPGSDTPAGDLWPGATDLVGFKKGEEKTMGFPRFYLFFFAGIYRLQLWKLTVRTRNTGVGSDEFPFGALPHGRCYVSFREGWNCWMMLDVLLTKNTWICSKKRRCSTPRMKMMQR